MVERRVEVWQALQVVTACVEAGLSREQCHGIDEALAAALGDVPVVDAYEVPDRLREHVIARNPVEVFPWSSRPSRSAQMDHTLAYDASAPAGSGQTRGPNLGPLGIRVHRWKTHGGVQLEQPSPGVFTWRTRAGFEYLVTPEGTYPLGRDPAGRR